MGTSFFSRYFQPCVTHHGTQPEPLAVAHSDRLTTTKHNGTSQYNIYPAILYRKSFRKLAVREISLPETDLLISSRLGSAYGDVLLHVDQEVLFDYWITKFHPWIMSQLQLFSVPFTILVVWYQPGKLVKWMLVSRWRHLHLIISTAPSYNHAEISYTLQCLQCSYRPNYCMLAWHVHGNHPWFGTFCLERCAAILSGTYLTLNLGVTPVILERHSPPGWLGSLLVMSTSRTGLNKKVWGVMEYIESLASSQPSSCGKTLPVQKHYKAYHEGDVQTHPKVLQDQLVEREKRHRRSGIASSTEPMKLRIYMMITR